MSTSMQRKNEKGEWPALVESKTNKTTEMMKKSSGSTDSASVSTNATASTSSGRSLGLSNSEVGRLIGTKGATIKRFEALFNVKVDIKRTRAADGSALVEVRSKDARSASAAVEAVKTFLRTGVAPWTVVTKTKTVTVPSRSIVEILDCKAVIGRATRTSISIPSREERGDSDRVRITVQGEREQDVTTAVTALEDIACVHCSPLVHPDRCYLQMKLREGERNVVRPMLRDIESHRGVSVYLPTNYHPYLVVVGIREEAVSMALADIERDLDAAEVIRKQCEENIRRKR